MWIDAITALIRLAILLGITLLMLVPTGMCICSDHDDESSSEQHEPGCPKVRKLDQPAKPIQVEQDLSSFLIRLENEVSPATTSGAVFSVGHGPPRGRPLYIAQRSLLI